MGLLFRIRFVLVFPHLSFLGHLASKLLGLFLPILCQPSLFFCLLLGFFELFLGAFRELDPFARILFLTSQIIFQSVVLALFSRLWPYPPVFSKSICIAPILLSSYCLGLDSSFFQSRAPALEVQTRLAFFQVTDKLVEQSHLLSGATRLLL